jgi:disulfide bond formation protein DsbB
VSVQTASTILAVLAVAGQVLLVLLIAPLLMALVGFRGSLNFVRYLHWGYELWAGFLIAALSVAGSLYFSLHAGFIPCELCWYQRIAMYPLAPLLLMMALTNDKRAARYLIPFPIVGLGFSIYHILVENGVVHQTSQCLVSAPGGCATKWINEFGYITIPTLAATAFALLIVFLIMNAFEPAEREVVEQPPHVLPEAVRVDSGHSS